MARVHPAHSVAAHPKGVWAAAILTVFIFSVIFSYFAVFEAVWNGQTPGKRWLRLRVIELSGRPITAFDSIARNLLRIVDDIAGCYAVGIICALLNSQSRRLGDYVVGTVVVREGRALWEKGTGFLDVMPAVAPQLAGISTSGLSAHEFRVVEAFRARRGQLPQEIRGQIALKVAKRVRNTLGLPACDQTPPEALLEQAAARFRDEAWFREAKKP